MNTTSIYSNRKTDKVFTKAVAIRFFATLTIVLVGLGLFVYAITRVSENEYSTTAKVFSVSEDGTQFVDGAGYVWEVSDTDYTENTFVEISFDNNGTDNNRLDDIIINVKPQRNLNKRVSIVGIN
jgi:hypothetical protein